MTSVELMPNLTQLQAGVLVKNYYLSLIGDFYRGVSFNKDAPTKHLLDFAL